MLVLSLKFVIFCEISEEDIHFLTHTHSSFSFLLPSRSPCPPSTWDSYLQGGQCPLLFHPATSWAFLDCWHLSSGQGKPAGKVSTVNPKNLPKDLEIVQLDIPLSYSTQLMDRPINLMSVAGKPEH